MNPTIQLERVEFVMTRACTARCRHCALGEPEEDSQLHLSYDKLAGLLAALKQHHTIESVMCFGGEPLLYPDDVCAILEEAKREGIPKRQVITNGYFARSESTVHAVAKRVSACATEILLSVDAFHQEYVPLKAVQRFAEAAEGIKLHPAWLVSAEHDNPYNGKTREILAQFAGLPITKGNVIFPAGRALTHLAEYVQPNNTAVSPYAQQPEHITCISINPNGEVTAAGQMLGSAYSDDLPARLMQYVPPRCGGIDTAE